MENELLKSVLDLKEKLKIPSNFWKINSITLNKFSMSRLIRRRKKLRKLLMKTRLLRIPSTNLKMKMARVKEQ